MFKRLLLLAGTIIVGGCAAMSNSFDSSGQVIPADEPYQSLEGNANQDLEISHDEFIDISFDDLKQAETAENLLGKNIKIEVSFIGVGPGIRGGKYRSNEYITYLVGRPVPKYFANNPMRGPVGHMFAVIPRQRVAEIASLQLEESITIFGKVVILGDASIGEYGINTRQIIKSSLDR